VLNGTDPSCEQWIRTYRDYAPVAPGQIAVPTAAPAAGGRRGGRSARVGV
jgi:5-methyltetrahydrofolate--homocysteine methyltransferase